MSSHPEQAAVEALLADLAARWSRNELMSIRELWHPDDDAPLYQPEEVEAPLTSWDAVFDYWQKTAESIISFEMRTWDLHVKTLAPDLLNVWYRMYWRGEIRGYDKPIGGENRVTATLQRTPDGWRYRQLTEAPIAPILYMRWLYEKAAE